MKRQKSIRPGPDQRQKQEGLAGRAKAVIETAGVVLIMRPIPNHRAASLGAQDSWIRCNGP